MENTIAQFTVTGISDISLDQLRKEMAIQDMKEMKMVFTNQLGQEITFNIEDIELIESEEL